MNSGAKLIIFVGLLNGKLGITISVGLCILLIFLFLFSSAIQNIYFLKSFAIDPIEKTLSLTITRFNSIDLEKQYQIKDIDIEICEIVVIYESYQLKITDKITKERIIRQPCVAGWNTRLFVEIIQELDKITGKNTDISMVKGAFKYGK